MTTAEFRPTHVVPQDGMPAWEAPDVGRPTAPLDALLPVQLVDRLGDWGRIVCANGWSAWVDGRLLVAVPRDPPGADAPLTRTADPGPLLSRTEDALGRYRCAAQELAEGGVDGESFRRRTRGLRVGVVVEGESVWLYDAEHERWVYCDGTQLSTYAAGGGPSVEGHGAEGGGAAGGAEGPGEAQGGGAVSGGPSGGVAGPEPTRVVAVEPPQVAEPGGTSRMEPDETQRVEPDQTQLVEPDETQLVEVVADPRRSPAHQGGQAAAQGGRPGRRPVPHGGRPAPLLPPGTDDPDPSRHPGDAR